MDNIESSNYAVVTSFTLSYANVAVGLLILESKKVEKNENKKSKIITVTSCTMGIV